MSFASSDSSEATATGDTWPPPELASWEAEGDGEGWEDAGKPFPLAPGRAAPAPAPSPELMRQGSGHLPPVPPPPPPPPAPPARTVASVGVPGAGPTAAAMADNERVV